MRAQISGLDQAASNVKDGISLVQTGEGALQEVQDMLNRMVTLATQSANGTYDETTDRANLQKEVDALKDEIDRIADSANFNGINLLDGSQAGATVTMDKWGNENAGSFATISINLSASTGSDLIGGKVTIGSKTFTVEEIGGSRAATSATIVGNVLKVGRNATAKTIASKISKSVTSVTAKLANGSSVKLKASVKNNVITYKASATAAKGQALDALSLPEFKVSTGLQLQIGDTADSYNQMKVGISDMHTSSLFIDSIDISTQDGAADAVNKIKNAINMVSSTRGDLGAVQNRLEHTQNNLSVMSENIQDAESTIRDTDVAEEMMSYTKNNILVQSAQAMLAQANSVPQGVLQLLQ
jgi:flagellin